MTTRLFLAFCILTSPLLALDTIQVAGNRFVTSDGETIILRGLNTSDPDKLEKEGMWSDAYFAEMAAWG
ncbi:glycoside hydrolase family 5 protein, partial [candidate division KSB1 bacterium]|nr:glycoside hydrolase family 5 protein [candidate division KSB1 bacterium]